ncbi:MAG: DUF4013 domain-containing protein [Anaerolineae bacterium]
MDIGRSFSYAFEDKDWPKKLAIGGLINIVPIFNLATMGYALRVMRASARGQEPTLPEWDRLGDDWVKGLLQWLALTILLMPLIPGHRCREHWHATGWTPAATVRCPYAALD